MTRYFKKLKPIIEQALKTQNKNLEIAANYIAATIKNDGLIYVFGSGHSHMIGEELFYRAGGLANVSPILIEPLMFHQGGITSSRLEHKHNFVTPYLKRVKISKKDTLIVISNSGRNEAPIDVALWAKKVKTKVITICSINYAKKMPTTHPGKKYLFEVADVNLDNHLPVGDAILSNKQLEVNYAPASTLINMVLIHSLFELAIDKSLKLGINPPVYKSANVNGGNEYNAKLFKKYNKRIPILK